MRLIHREAERFERALTDGHTTDEALAPLVSDAHLLVAVGSTAAGPSPEFVAGLRSRLVAEAAELPVRPSVTRPSALTEGAARRPLVVVVGRGVPRALAGLTATVLAVGGIVGAASQSALPGGALYPVRGFLDTVAVQLSGSEFDRGVTGLEQAQQHVLDARSLASRNERDVSLYASALDQATAAVTSSTDRLMTDYSRTTNPQALLALTDFVSRVDPQLDAARDELPAEALPDLAALREAVDTAQRRATVSLAACAPECISTQAVADLVERAGGLAALGGDDVISELFEETGLDTQASTTATPSVVVPDAPVVGQGANATTSTGGSQTTAPRAPSASSSASGAGTGTAGSATRAPSLPVSVGAGTGGVTVGVGGGGATVGTGGVTVNGPAITVLPSVGVTVPSITVGLPGLGVSVPDQTLGGIVVPGLSVKAPKVRGILPTAPSTGN